MSRAAARPVVRNHVDAGVAACLLMAMSNKEIARAIGKTAEQVESLVGGMAARAGKRNRVGLALALFVEAEGSV